MIRRLVCFFVLIFVTVSYIFAEKCIYHKLKKITQTRPCNQAINLIFKGGWQVDGALTVKTNKWPNSSVAFINNIKGGIGNCAMYKMVYKETEDCCRGWTGVDCDIASCSHACIHGSCAGPDTCSCAETWSGRSCDENTKAVTDSGRYCYIGGDCKSNKRFNASVVSKDACCSDGSDASWGHHGDNETQGQCLSCLKEKSLVTAVTRNKRVPFRTCVSGLACAVRTFDGVTYNYCTHCLLDLVNTADIVISMHTDESLHQKVVTIRAVYRQIRYTLTNDSVAMSSDNHDERLEVVNFGDIREHAVQIGELVVNIVGDSIFIAMPRYDLRVRRDNNMQVFITVGSHSPLRKDHIQGACGNYDDDFTDELKLANNEKEARKFGLAWTDKSCHNRPREINYHSEIKKGAEIACSVLSSKLFERCHSQIDVRSYVQSCIGAYSLAKHDNDKDLNETLCKAVGAYASVCAMENVVIHWRTDAFCPKHCPANMVYRQCGPSCKPTCGYPIGSYLKNECDICCPGCHCDEGLVLHNGVCIEPTNCPCVYKHEDYAFGQALYMNETCQQCTCGHFGHWNCTVTPCRATCSVYGPGVLTTFDGEEFRLGTHDATCGYILVSVLKTKLEIKLRARLCENQTSAMCATGFEVKSGKQHISVELTLSGGFRLLDLVMNTHRDLPFFNGGFYVRQTTGSSLVADFNGFRLTIYANNYLAISTDQATNFGIVRGLCGNLNNLISDERLLPSGVEADSDSIFVAAFSDNKCGSILSLPQLPANEQQCTSLKLLYEAFNQTQSTTENIYRICMTYHDPLKMCSVILKLAVTADISLTSLLDYPLDDTDIIEACANELMSCEKGLVYREDIDICTTNCLDLAFGREKCQHKIFHGCSCADGFYRNNNGTCVPKSQCSCLNIATGKYYKPGLVDEIPCHECHCTQGKLRCQERGCEKIVCPKDQVAIVTKNASTVECLNYKCPDRYSNQITCADNSSYTKKCVCKEGYVMTQLGTCVQYPYCPCYHEGVWHKNGTDIMDKCFLKRCNNGIWMITERTKCQATCIITGSETQIETFDGTTYSFHAKSAYTLMKTQGDGHGFKISFSLACESNERACSHKIDINFMGIHLELVPGAGVIVGNKTYSLDEPQKIGIFKVMSTTLYTVINFLDVTVYWSGGLLTWIQVSSRWDSKLEGLCGTYDYNTKNDFYKPDGSIDPDLATFTDSWKEEDIIVTHQNESSPCQNNPGKMIWSRAKCNIIKSSQAFQQCREAMPRSHIDKYVADCEKTTCWCNGDSDSDCLCDTIAHFATVCDSLGHPAAWRHQNLCPVQCGGDMIYSYNHRPCKTTCLDLINNATQCDILSGVEGCFCPPGKVWHESRCIPSTQCPCYNGTYLYDPGTVLKKEDCKICVCGEGQFVCRSTNCSECLQDEFKCITDGMCIHQSDVCNGIFNCYDGSDENSDLCDKKNCSSEQFQCKLSGECIPSSQVCDDIAHCDDGSDEHKDKCKTVCDHRCQDGRCLYKDYICDGYFDCIDGSDEIGCATACEHGYFKCNKSGECIKGHYVCDGHDDCGDGFDELGCASLNTSPRHFETEISTSRPDVSINPETPQTTEFSGKASPETTNTEHQRTTEISDENVNMETVTTNVATHDRKITSSAITANQNTNAKHAFVKDVTSLVNLFSHKEEAVENAFVSSEKSTMSTLSTMKLAHITSRPPNFETVPEAPLETSELRVTDSEGVQTTLETLTPSQTNAEQSMKTSVETVKSRQTNNEMTESTVETFTSRQTHSEPLTETAEHFTSLQTTNESVAETTLETFISEQTLSESITETTFETVTPNKTNPVATLESITKSVTTEITNETTTSTQKTPQPTLEASTSKPMSFKSSGKTTLGTVTSRLTNSETQAKTTLETYTTHPLTLDASSEIDLETLTSTQKNSKTSPTTLTTHHITPETTLETLASSQEDETTIESFASLDLTTAARLTSNQTFPKSTIESLVSKQANSETTLETFTSKQTPKYVAETTVETVTSSNKKPKTTLEMTKQAPFESSAEASLETSTHETTNKTSSETTLETITSSQLNPETTLQTFTSIQTNPKTTFETFTSRQITAETTPEKLSSKQTLFQSSAKTTLKTVPSMHTHSEPQAETTPDKFTTHWMTSEASSETPPETTSRKTNPDSLNKTAAEAMTSSQTVSETTVEAFTSRQTNSKTHAETSTVHETTFETSTETVSKILMSSQTNSESSVETTVGTSTEIRTNSVTSSETALEASTTYPPTPEAASKSSVETLTSTKKEFLKAETTVETSTSLDQTTANILTSKQTFPKTTFVTATIRQTNPETTIQLFTPKQTTKSLAERSIETVTSSNTNPEITLEATLEQVTSETTLEPSIKHQKTNKPPSETTFETFTSRQTNPETSKQTLFESSVERTLATVTSKQTNSETQAVTTLETSAMEWITSKASSETILEAFTSNKTNPETTVETFTPRQTNPEIQAESSTMHETTLEASSETVSETLTSSQTNPESPAETTLGTSTKMWTTSETSSETTLGTSTPMQTNSETLAETTLETDTSSKTNPETSLKVSTSKFTPPEYSADTTFETITTHQTTNETSETMLEAFTSNQTNPEITFEKFTSIQTNPETTLGTITSRQITDKTTLEKLTSKKTLFEFSTETPLETVPSIRTHSEPQAETTLEKFTKHWLTSEASPKTVSETLTSSQTNYKSPAETTLGTSTEMWTTSETSSETTLELSTPMQTNSETLAEATLETYTTYPPTHEASCETTVETLTSKQKDFLKAETTVETSTSLDQTTAVILTSKQKFPKTALVTATTRQTNPETTIELFIPKQTTKSLAETNLETVTSSNTNPETSLEVTPEQVTSETTLETSTTYQKTNKTPSDTTLETFTSSPETSKQILFEPSAERTIETVTSNQINSETTLETSTAKLISFKESSETTLEGSTSIKTNPEITVKAFTTGQTTPEIEAESSTMHETTIEASSETVSETLTSSQTNPELPAETTFGSLTKMWTSQTSSETNLETSTPLQTNSETLAETTFGTSTAYPPTPEASSEITVETLTSKQTDCLKAETTVETSTLLDQTTVDILTSKQTYPKITLVTVQKNSETTLEAFTSKQTTLAETTIEIETPSKTNPETSLEVSTSKLIPPEYSADTTLETLTTHKTTNETPETTLKTFTSSQTNSEITLETSSQTLFESSAETTFETVTSKMTNSETQAEASTTYETTLEASSETASEILTSSQTNPQASTVANLGTSTQVSTTSEPSSETNSETFADTTLETLEWTTPTSIAKITFKTKPETTFGTSSSAQTTSESSVEITLETFTSNQTNPETLAEITPATSISTSVNTVYETSASTLIKYNTSKVEISHQRTAPGEILKEVTTTTQEMYETETHEMIHHFSTTPVFNKDCPGECLSSWSCWSACPRPCKGTRVRVRSYDTDNPLCKCSEEVIPQAESCSCNRTSTSLTLSATTAEPCQCDSSKECTSCFDQCEQSCRTFRSQALCQKQDGCSPGCKCPDGYLMDDDQFCTPSNYCPCYDTTGAEVPYNCSYIDPGSCKICKCTENGAVCEDKQNEFEVLYEWTVWSDWSPCSSSCGTGISFRNRTGQHFGCSTRQEELKPCSGQECHCVSQTGDMVQEGQTYRPDECRICRCVKGDFVCKTDPSRIVNGEFEEWSQWSPCGGNCSLFSKTRSRYCKPPVCGGSLCDGAQMETSVCSWEPCCQVFKWSDWTPCSQTCGPQSGSRSRHKIYADDNSSNKCAGNIIIDACGLCSCDDENQTSIAWSEWTSCTNEGVDCGWGKRTRHRTVSDTCVSKRVESKQTQPCFMGPCNCSKHLVWSNNSLCERKCHKHQPVDCSLHISGGCICPYNLHSNGDQCVVNMLCPNECVYNNITYQDGQHFSCDDCQICQCVRGQIEKVGRKECPDVRKCNLSTHHLVPSGDGCCLVDCIPQETCSVHQASAEHAVINNCRSVAEVTRQVCAGPCPTKSDLLDYTTLHETHLKCKACSPRSTVYKAVEFKCNNGTTLIHPLPFITECSCVV